ncbi:MAG: biotin transporter BioY [Clostridiales bacterium]|nr:biotin transporter BioY [Clostridiales bacterium]
MENTANKTSTRTYNLVLEAICAALITICAWISLQVMEVPFTLQTFGILLVLFTIGGRRGTISIAIYLLLGLIGLPVFAGFKGGPAALMGPTGGFIIGFLLMGLVYWALDVWVLGRFKKSASSRLIVSIIEGVLGEVVLYVFGVAWFMFVYTRNTGAIGLGAVLGMCVIPFLIPDAVKLIVAATVSLRTVGIVKKQ